MAIDGLTCPECGKIEVSFWACLFEEECPDHVKGEHWHYECLFCGWKRTKPFTATAKAREE
jgi:hypothetical protein